jgi:hypothetical protein
MHRDDELSTEARRTAIEVMACIPWWKRDLIERILIPAGVPREVYVTHLNRTDEFTGRKIDLPPGTGHSARESRLLIVLLV